MGLDRLLLRGRRIAAECPSPPSHCNPFHKPAAGRSPDACLWCGVRTGDGDGGCEPGLEGGPDQVGLPSNDMDQSAWTDRSIHPIEESVRFSHLSNRRSAAGVTSRRTSVLSQQPIFGTDRPIEKDTTWAPKCDARPRPVECGPRLPKQAVGGWSPWRGPVGRVGRRRSDD